jgi:chromosome segregation ATPase
MSRREQIEELLQEVLPKIEGLKEEALAEIGRVREDANGKMHRHEEVAGELAEAEAEIEALSARKEELPAEVTRTNLEELYEEEDSLREEYRGIGPRLEALEERRVNLEAELPGLLPRNHGHKHDGRIHHTARVAGTAHEERAALDDLKARLIKAADEALKPVEKAHNDTKGLVEAWSMDREWDPAFREKVYGRRAG